MNDNIRRSLGVLELPANATLEEAKQAYRDLVIVWHPDRHQNNDRLKSKADEKLKQINNAWDELKKYFSTHDQELKGSTYIDPQTGLMWVKHWEFSEKRMNWNDAMIWVRKLNIGGYCDWRLPSIDEFYAISLRDTEIPYHWFLKNGFNAVHANRYWSSSDNIDFAMTFNMGKRNSRTSNSKNSELYVWPVRETSLNK